MEALPAPKFQQRSWRFTRKRRRSANETGDSEGNTHISALFFVKPYFYCFLSAADGKMVKKDENKMDVEAPAAATAAN